MINNDQHEHVPTKKSQATLSTSIPSLIVNHIGFCAFPSTPDRLPIALSFALDARVKEPINSTDLSSCRILSKSLLWIEEERQFLQDLADVVHLSKNVFDVDVV